jgi:hypothetical protein
MTDVPIIDSPRAYTRERDRWQLRHRCHSKEYTESTPWPAPTTKP